MRFLSLSSARYNTIHCSQRAFGPLEGGRTQHCPVRGRRRGRNNYSNNNKVPYNIRLRWLTCVEYCPIFACIATASTARDPLPVIPPSVMVPSSALFPALYYNNISLETRLSDSSDFLLLHRGVVSNSAGGDPFHPEQILS